MKHERVHVEDLMFIEERKDLFLYSIGYHYRHKEDPTCRSFGYLDDIKSIEGEAMSVDVRGHAVIITLTV